MSQIYKSLTSGPVPPAVPTSFVTDINSPSVPIANIENVFGGSVTTNNTNGVQTDGSSGSNTITVELTNRMTGSGTTVGAGTADIITFTPTVIGTYSIEFRSAAYNTTSSLGAGYSYFGAIRFDGVNSTTCDTFDQIDNEEGTMSNSELDVVVSGANVILRAIGYAGQTINWSSVGLYTFVGV